MSLIGTKRLLELVSEIGLVENLCERELNHPEGAGFDLRVGEVYAIKDENSFLGISSRSTPEAELIAKFGREQEYILMPGDYRLVKTIEKINLPGDIAALFRPRTTLQRSGIALFTATGAPGYCARSIFLYF